MAERTAKAGGGNWNATTTWEPEVVPVAGDDVFLKSTSGNVTITAAAVCRSLNCTGYTAILEHKAFNLSIGTTTAPPEGKALVFSEGMTYTITNALTSKIILLSSVASTTQTLDFKGKTTGNVEITTAVATTNTYKVLSANAMGATSTFIYGKGILDLNGLTYTWGLFSSSNANVRELKLGAAEIKLSGTGAAWECTNTSNLTVAANTATVTLSGATATFNGGFNWNGLKLQMTGSGVATLAAASSTFGAFTREGTEVKTDSLTVTGPVTVSNKVTLKGKTLTNRLLVRGVTLGTKSVISAKEVALENVDFMDIKGEGEATWSGTSIGDALGNEGITRTAPVERFAKAAGNWSSTAVWAATSGGSAGASVPLCHDTVKMNSTAGAGSYAIDMPRLCADLNCEGFTRTLSSSVEHRIYGSVTLAAGMTHTAATTRGLCGRSTHTVTSAGKTMGSVDFEGPGSIYTLEDAFSVGSANVVLLAGELNTNGKKLTAGRLICNSSTTKKLTGGTSTFELTGTSGPLAIVNTALTISLTETTIVFTGKFAAFAIALEAGTGTPALGIVECTNAEASVLIANNAWSCTTLKLTAGQSVKFSTTGATTVSVFTAIGTEAKHISIESSLSGTPAVLKCASGIIEGSWLKLKDSKAEGGAGFYAGHNSESVSGNSGWIFASFTEGKASVSGSGTVSALGTVTAGGKVEGSVSIAGSGTITSAGTRTVLGQASVSGSGTIVAKGLYTAFGKVIISGSGSIQDTGSRAALGQASISGSGLITSTGLITRFGKALILGTGGVVAKGIDVELDTASISGAGTITAKGEVRSKVLGQASINGFGSVTTQGVYTALGKASISGVGTIASKAIAIFASKDAISGTGTIAAKGLYIALGKSSVVGQGLVVSKGIKIRLGKASIGGTGNVLASGSDLTSTGKASVAGVGNLSTSGIRTVFGQADIGGIGILTGIGARVVSESGSIVGQGLVNSTGLCIIVGEALIVGQGDFTVIGNRSTTTNATIIGVGETRAAGAYVVIDSVTVNGIGSILAEGIPLESGNSSIQGSGLLTATSRIGKDLPKHIFLSYDQSTVTVLENPLELMVKSETNII